MWRERDKQDAHTNVGAPWYIILDCIFRM